ncbi:AarF/ABC1/UbiB kinase family protein [Roseomonas sp. HJA6]|uniref:AarF/ABC1/UbiB kinase family protein n=1 Tax=Roseomonas alba TaxID=2846776 RepID=A0ABS7A6Z9_9PROT|nr:AarF/ABC1/UbiB kinase family protein [Neoroseomonas alba]MBW6396934.1 AarF/ABC1/UbiB kinase family protein [Neoroseomonas alba]
MADKDGSTLFGEARRMLRTSSAVGGIAARVAGQRLFGMKTDKAAHAEDLKAILGGLKGPMMKVAQFLSTVPDALPPEYAKELATLQANAPPMGWPFVRRRMASELGPAWEARFASFEREAAAAASLGQVHRAVLPDGTRVACKLQYPDMASVVEADLRQLKIAMALYRRMDPTLENDEAYIELSDRLREELDYTREAAQQRLYGLMLKDAPGVRVPTPVEGFCTKRLLTMTWLDGHAIQARIDENPPQEERNAYARALFRAWYLPLYRYGVIHGDPHLGNYQVRGDCPENDGFGINLLDFGVIRVFPAPFIGGVIMLYEAMRDDDFDKAAEAYRIWGFRDLKRETMEVLNTWARFLYEPLLDARVRPIQVTDDPNYGRKIAEEVHAGLKRTGGVRVPREFPLMDRAAIGLGSVFLRLGAKLNWHDLFHELVADFDAVKLAERQTAALVEAGVPAGA